MDMELSTQSILTDGTVITKKELLEYFVRYLQAMHEYDCAAERLKQYEPQIAALEMDSKRRTFTLPHREPPHGLAALSFKEKRRYNEWLAAAPEREAELKEKEAAEDRRLKEVETKLVELKGLKGQDSAVAASAKKELDAISAENVLPRAYMQPDIIIALAKLFVTNRAHTLTDAINLYHQELQWQKMNEMQQRQMRENAAAFRTLAAQNQKHAAQIIAEQRETAAELRDSLDEIKRAANDAKFYAEMNFLYDLF